MVNASPMVGAGQEQTGMWLDTVQRAPTPQVPGQGSILTLGPDASLRLGAIGVHQALRLTAFVGVSSVARNALAVRAIVSLSAVSVDTAGRRTAGS